MHRLNTRFIAASPVALAGSLGDAVNAALHVGFVGAVEVGCCGSEEAIGASRSKHALDGSVLVLVVFVRHHVFEPTRCALYNSSRAR